MAAAYDATVEAATELSAQTNVLVAMTVEAQDTAEELGESVDLQAPVPHALLLTAQAFMGKPGLGAWVNRPADEAALFALGCRLFGEQPFANPFNVRYPGEPAEPYPAEDQLRDLIAGTFAAKKREIVDGLKAKEEARKEQARQKQEKQAQAEEAAKRRERERLEEAARHADAEVARMNRESLEAYRRGGDDT